MLKGQQLIGFGVGGQLLTIPYVELYDQKPDTSNGTTMNFNGMDFGTDNGRRVVVACVTSEASDDADVTGFTIGGVDVFTAGQYRDRFRDDGSNVNSAAIGWAEVSGATGNVAVTYNNTQRSANCVVVVCQDVNDIDSVLSVTGASINTNNNSTGENSPDQDSVAIACASVSSTSPNLFVWGTGSQGLTGGSNWDIDSGGDAHGSFVGYRDGVNEGLQDFTIQLTSNADRIVQVGIWIK